MEYAREPNWKFSDRAPGKPISSRLVRKERLELSRVTPLEPKSSASTSSATFAPRYYEVTRLRAAQQSLPSPLAGEDGCGVRETGPTLRNDSPLTPAAACRAWETCVILMIRRKKSGGPSRTRT